MEREARCMCGELRIKTSGEPILTLACNCHNCQRRTGSVFGVGAYFDNSMILEKKGTPRKFDINTESGNAATSNFCEKCGSTLYIEAEMFRGMTGIPVGCFTDPSFPEPTLAAWCRSKYEWVDFPEHWHSMSTQASNNT